MRSSLRRPTIPSLRHTEMSYSYHTADVFTDRAFGGNQLAVIPDARGLSDDDMAAMAWHARTWCTWGS